MKLYLKNEASDNIFKVSYDVEKMKPFTIVINETHIHCDAETFGNLIATIFENMEDKS